MKTAGTVTLSDGTSSRTFQTDDLDKVMDFMCGRFTSSMEQTQKFAIAYHEWMTKNGWHKHTNEGWDYFYKLEHPSEWPPKRGNEANQEELLTRFREELINKALNS